MKTFKDNAARDWSISVTVDAIKRVRAACGVDLLKVVEENCKLLGELSDDPVLLVDVLYAVCRPEAEERSISAEQFGAAMRGDSIWTACHALIDDLIDFFPDPRKRTLLGKLLAKLRTAAGIIQDQAEKQVDSLDPSSVLQMLGGPSTNSPASSGSAPAP